VTYDGFSKPFPADKHRAITNIRPLAPCGLESLDGYTKALKAVCGSVTDQPHTSAVPCY
jgi:hypothetical protein